MSILRSPSLLAAIVMLAGSSLSMAAEETVTIKGPTHSIPVTVTLPDGDGPFPFVVMFHGTGSNRHEAGNGYDLLAPKLAEAGIASARFDFAGNGDSTVSYREYTPLGGMEDGLAVIGYMRGLRQIDDDRLGVLGWSQGGYVAMLAAARIPGVRSAVTWAGVLDMTTLWPELYEEARANGFGVMKFEWRTPLELDLKWFEQVHSIKLNEELGKYDGAILAIAGSKDTVVPPAVTGEIVAAAGGEPKEAEIIEGADHTFNIFTADRSAFDKLMASTIKWFKDTL